MKRVFFFDIDGTLLPNGHKEPLASTIYAINELKKNGDLVFIATGKNLTNSQYLGELLGVDNYITTNGQTISVDNQIIHEEYLGHDELEFWTSLAKKHDCLIGFQSNFDVYVLESSKYHMLQRFFDIVDIKYPVIEQEIRANEHVNQMIIVGDYDQINYDKEKYKIVNWTEIGADILPINVSKGRGINWFLKNAPTKYVSYAFGDGHNDLEMFDAVDYSIAMGNSHEEVKARAMQVTGDATNDGIYNYLVANKLIKEMS